MKFKKQLVFLVAISILIRVFISIWSLQFRENPDVLRMRDWAGIAHAYSLADTYKTSHLTFGTLPNNAPPGEIYIMSGMYELNVLSIKTILKLTHQSPAQLDHLSNQMLDIFLKIPSLISDIGIGLIIFLFFKKSIGERKALISTAFFLFNPVTIYNSALWGQTDSIVNFFFLLSLLFILENKFFRAFLFFFLSLFIKLSLLYVFPFFFIFIMFKKHSLGKSISYFILSAFVIIILTLPVSASPLNWIVSFFANNATGEIKNISAFAFNFWWFVFKPKIEIGFPINSFSFSEIELLSSPLSSQIFLSIPLFAYALLLFLLTTLPVIILTLRKKVVFHKQNFIKVLSLIILSGFLFLPQMHERYLYPIFPLIAILIGFEKDYLIYYVLLSLLNFLNIYFVWHPMLSPSLPYQTMNSQLFQWLISAITVVTSASFYMKTLKQLAHET